MDTVMQSLVMARKVCGLTQKELAAKTGIDQADISKLEKGRGNPTFALLQRLAQAMDMQLELTFYPSGSDTSSAASESIYLERHLPVYLQEDIANLMDGRKRNLVMRLDGLYNEVQSSINVAYHNGAIDDAQAGYLRRKYLH